MAQGSHRHALSLRQWPHNTYRHCTHIGDAHWAISLLASALYYGLAYQPLLAWSPRKERMNERYINCILYYLLAYDYCFFSCFDTIDLVHSYSIHSKRFLSLRIDEQFFLLCGFPNFSFLQPVSTSIRNSS